MYVARLFLGLVLVASLSACGDDHPTIPAPSTIPTGVTWKLKCIGSPSTDTCYDPDRGQLYSIRFENDGTVSGTNACNACSGTFSYVSATQVAIVWSCTEAGCGTPSPWLGYGDSVAQTTSFAVVDGELVLTYLDRSGESIELIHQQYE